MTKHFHLDFPHNPSDDQIVMWKKNKDEFGETQSNCLQFVQLSENSKKNTVYKNSLQPVCQF